MILRARLLKQIIKGLKLSPVTALMGPRQSGKTTLAKELARQFQGVYLDLENPLDLARLKNPIRELTSHKGLIVLDEAQRFPDLYPVLRVLSDQKPLRRRFLILGSASLDLVKGVSESLAGRAHFVDIGGFTLEEAGPSLNKLWVRGGFPPSFLARTETASQTWRENFIRTFLERDIPQLGLRIPASTLQRFWTMLAHYHAQTWNGSEIAASLGIAHTTSKHYLDILSGTFLLRQLQPWFENVGKRVVKAPKVYIRDSGILHALLQISNQRNLESHPKYGASWEGFALEQLLSRFGERNCYFWGTHAGAELDLLVLRNGKRWGFEFKTSETPVPTKSMHIALHDLKLERLWVVYPGKESYALSEKINCISLLESLNLSL